MRERYELDFRIVVKGWQQLRKRISCLILQWEVFFCMVLVRDRYEISHFTIKLSQNTL